MKKKNKEKNKTKKLKKKRKRKRRRRRKERRRRRRRKRRRGRGRGRGRGGGGKGGCYSLPVRATRVLCAGCTCGSRPSQSAEFRQCGARSQEGTRSKDDDDGHDGGEREREAHGVHSAWLDTHYVIGETEEGERVRTKGSGRIPRSDRSKDWDSSA
jgi:hypothetical protein